MPMHISCGIHLFLRSSLGQKEHDRSLKEIPMHDLSRQRFSWHRPLLKLVTIMTIIPALLVSFGLLLSGTAQASGSLSHLPIQHQAIVNPEVKHDVSPPLSSIAPLHTVSPKQRPLLLLPTLPQGTPNRLQDNVQSTLASVPTRSAPSPSTN